MLTFMLLAVVACGGVTNTDAPASGNDQTGSQANARPEDSPSPSNTPGRHDAPQTSGEDSRESERTDEAETESSATSTQEFKGTAGITERKHKGGGVAILRAVRTAAHSSFDRVVFEFEGSSLPGYQIEYIDRPIRQCGSGRVVPLAGDGWLRVRLEPANAHTEQGEPTITDRERRPNHPNLKELKLICDFEAQVEWVLGLGSPNRYRVLELSKPARLVMDVRR